MKRNRVLELVNKNAFHSQFGKFSQIENFWVGFRLIGPRIPTSHVPSLRVVLLRGSPRMALRDACKLGHRREIACYNTAAILRLIKIGLQIRI